MNLIDEAKRLQNKYKELGVNDCYCGQSSVTECPAHIDTYIASLERPSSNANSNHTDLFKLTKDDK